MPALTSPSLQTTKIQDAFNLAADGVREMRSKGLDWSNYLNLVTRASDVIAATDELSAQEKEFIIQSAYLDVGLELADMLGDAYQVKIKDNLVKQRDSVAPDFSPSWTEFNLIAAMTVATGEVAQQGKKVEATLIDQLVELAQQTPTPAGEIPPSLAEKRDQALKILTGPKL